MELIIEEKDVGKRLDQLLTEKFSDHSRTYFQNLITKGDVKIDGKSAKKRHLAELGETISVIFPPPPEMTLNPENTPLEILYEDDYLLVINKPAGLVVHPGAGTPNGTLVNALLHYLQSLPQSDDPLRPGIVHRLDKETSGAIVVAKTESAHRKLIELFSERKVEKTYRAISVGNPGARTVDLPIGRNPRNRQEMAIVENGKPAQTTITPLSSDGELTHLKLDLHTGRTHQIRVHLKHLKTPILGDKTYGFPRLNLKYNVSRQLLHAETLTFPHPITDETISIIAPLPTDFNDV